MFLTAVNMSETLPISKKQVPRQLRERKQRKLYSDEWALGDDEAEGGRGFSLADKLESPRFEHSGAVLEMHGSDISVSYLQKNGFTTPLLFKEKLGLGLRVPTSNFTVNDVRMCVGSRRMLDVMDVNTQKNIEMTMKDWQRYYDDPNKERLLNVISLEFSHTRLENYVQAPLIVRQIDWVDTVWPRHLKDQQTESTNALDDMMYPKVQKYCLMSVKGCYTDFHIDFGGTSVWYHILRGAKVFWLIPPTEKNLQLYEKWVLSGKQSDVFFGDTVEKCIRVHLQAGHTFFIPTGWIHAVYTPSDSLVFGGNFLHQFGIEKQLKIAQVEDVTKVPQKFRYPFFTEMLWYVLDRYVGALLGRSHLAAEGQPTPPPAPNPPKEHVHLTQNELHGLKAIVMYLHQLPAARKSVPELLSDPIALVRDVRTLVEQHRHDKQQQAITGVPVLKGPDEVTTGERRQSSGPAPTTPPARPGGGAPDARSARRASVRTAASACSATTWSSSVGSAAPSRPASCVSVCSRCFLSRRHAPCATWTAGCRRPWRLKPKATLAATGRRRCASAPYATASCTPRACSPAARSTKTCPTRGSAPHAPLWGSTTTTSRATSAPARSRRTFAG